MPSKRRNNGRNKKNKGHADVLRCSNCGRCVGKDKAVKRFQMRNMVDGSSKRDIKENSAYDQADFQIPKIYVKLGYCVSCAIHARIVRVRSRGDRKVRYTTRLRQHIRAENATGNASLPLSALLGKPQTQQQ